jgi:hypothetical protein
MPPKKSYEQISEWERIHNKHEKMIEDNFYLERTEKFLKEYKALENKLKDLTYRKNMYMNWIKNALNKTKPIDEKRKEAEKIKNIAAEKIQKVFKVHQKKKAVEKAANVITKNAHKAMYNPDTKLGEKILKRRFDENPNLAKVIKFKK